MRILLVYYTFSLQTQRVAEVMAEALVARGFEVTTAAIELTDTRYAERFSRLPMRRPILELVGMLPAQLRRANCEIRIPPEAQAADYDLVVIGSPTWWLTTSMPIRSYLRSPAARAALDQKPFAAFSVSRRYWKGNVRSIERLGKRNGGTWVDEAHFVAAGGQVRSMLAWLAYMKHGEPREHVLGLRMPPPNLGPDFAEQARSFIDAVADRVFGAR